ncbi:hypothetical protein [Streptomyces sp. NPDC050528]|uniref:hypothetical protein n=1 Tax=Streptomyces sp. NPDC050528 TaxID=3365623 RepID=UPI00379EE536
MTAALYGVAQVFAVLVGVCACGTVVALLEVGCTTSLCWARHSARGSVCWRRC